MEIFHICLFFCASALITCATITSHMLLPCDLIGWLDGCFEYWYSYYE